MRGDIPDEKRHSVPCGMPTGNASPWNDAISSPLDSHNDNRVGRLRRESASIIRATYTSELSCNECTVDVVVDVAGMK